jgi:hypothetical protein
MKTMETYPQLMESLNDVRRHWRVNKLVEGALLAIAGTVAVLVAVVAADNLLGLDKLGRTALAVLLWGTLITAVLGLVVRRFLEDRRDDFFAALVEKKHPDLHNKLINALQLGRGNQAGHSPRLIAAIIHDAAVAAAELDMAGSLDWRGAKRAGIFAAIAGIFCLAYAALLWPYFSTGLARVLLPVADIDPYTATRIKVLHERDRVAEGSPVLISAEVSGVIPGKVQLYLKTGDNRWQHPVAMKAGDDKDGVQLFTYKAAQVTKSFDYYIEGGDARSSVFHVQVVKRPQVKDLAITYARPAYTGLKPYTVDKADGEISGIAGTTVTLKVKSTKPLREAQLVAKNGQAEPVVVSFQRAGAEDVWQGSFVLWNEQAQGGEDIPGDKVKGPGQYHLRLLDTDGYTNLDPLVRPINLVADEAPSVAVTQPGANRDIKPGEQLALRVEAQDDFGIGTVRIHYRVGKETTVRTLKTWVHRGGPRVQTADGFTWKNPWKDLAALGLKAGGKVEYWATASDRNVITGPGTGKSGSFTLTLLSPEAVKENMEEAIFDFAEIVEKLLQWQRENRDQTANGHSFAPLIERQIKIRTKTAELADRMEESRLPVMTMVQILRNLHRGLMRKAISTLEQGRDAGEQDAAAGHRREAVKIENKIIAELEALLLRLQTNERAKKALRKIEKKDKAAHKKITEQLTKMIKDLDSLLKDETKLVSKFQRMPKKPKDETKEDKMKLTKEMEEMQQKWAKWAKGTIDELAKLPTGFVKDFVMKKDVNSIYEEIEKAAERSKASKIEVSLEDMGVGLGTKMKEDLETWMPDSADATKWVMEEPLNKKTPKVPEMPLPKELEDLIGDLLQKADEFDEEADDVTSSWGDNLDQAGWGVSDGPISTFSAKGKTGNDLPNNNELNGRSGDGRRGKSKGQMVGDTARNLQGRNTPARVGNERYEPGQLKQEKNADPKGATGGGKKAGAGRKGLQGGTPPDVVKNIGRLSAKQAGLREKAEQIAKKLAAKGLKSGRLIKGIQLFKQSEKDLRDLRYKDAARKRKLALRAFKGAALEVDQTTGLHVSQTRDLPPELRKELLQGADDSYPPGYEGLLKNYYKELSKAEK